MRSAGSPQSLAAAPGAGYPTQPAAGYPAGTGCPLGGVGAGRGQLGGAALQLDELGDDLVLARLGAAERGRAAVGLAVLAELLEAAVARPGAAGGLGIDLVEVGDHRVDRGVEAVEVEAVEASLSGRPEPLRPARGQAVVVLAQPTDEVEH